MARWNSPLARGIASSVATLMAPADFAEDGDLAGIAAEGPDVLLHPFERGDLVEKAQVGDAVAQVEEAFRAHPVIDGHAHHAIAGEPAAVIEGRRAGGVELEHSTGDPDHHRPPRGPKSGVQMLSVRQSSPWPTSSGMASAIPADTPPEATSART